MNEPNLNLKADRTLIPDVLAALIITIGLFIGSLGILDGARSADFSSIEQPACRDQYQKSHKAVLHCAPERQSE